MRFSKPLIISAVVAVSGAAFAHDITVGSGPHADFTTIQAAVNAAQPGDKITVQPGTYAEQIDINSSKGFITLQAAHGVTIVPPNTMTSGFLVTVDGAEDITFKGFTLAGPLPDAAFSSGVASGGIYVRGGGSAIIANNYLTQMWQATAANRGVQNGIGILVGRQFDGTTGSAWIQNNTLDHWQKTGIVIDNSGSVGVVSNNQLTGEGPITYTAQNGIQVGRGASALVDNNKVSALSYTPGTYDASGILIFETSYVSVTNNQVKAADLGVAFADVNYSSISHNHISNGQYGIDVDEFSAGSQNNEIDHNDSTNNSQEGVYVSVDSINNLFDHNNFRNNAYLDAEDDSVGSGTAGTGNTWTKNHIGTDNKSGGLGQ